MKALEEERQKLMHKKKDPKYDLLVASKELDENEYKSGMGNLDMDSIPFDFSDTLK